MRMRLRQMNMHLVGHAGRVVLLGALALAGQAALAQPAAAPAPASAPPATYFVLFDDGGEHVPDDCDASARLPARLSKKPLRGTAGYLGSKQVEFASRNGAGIDAFEHYFSDVRSCRAALKKMSES